MYIVYHEISKGYFRRLLITNDFDYACAMRDGGYTVEFAYWRA